MRVGCRTYYRSLFLAEANRPIPYKVPQCAAEDMQTVNAILCLDSSQIGSGRSYNQALGDMLHSIDTHSRELATYNEVLNTS